MRNRMLSALMLLAASGHATLAQRVETGFLDRMASVGGQGYRYQVYVPADYTSRTD